MPRNTHLSGSPPPALQDAHEFSLSLSLSLPPSLSLSLSLSLFHTHLSGSPQDAHEFLNWLLNDISEALEKEERAAQSAARRASRDASRASSRASSRAHSPTKARSPTKGHGGGPGRSPSLQLLSAAAAKAAAARNRPVRTWVHDLFQVRGCLPGHAVLLPIRRPGGHLMALCWRGLLVVSVRSEGRDSAQHERTIAATGPLGSRVVTTFAHVFLVAPTPCRASW